MPKPTTLLGLTGDDKLNDIGSASDIENRLISALKIVNKNQMLCSPPILKRIAKIGSLSLLVTGIALGALKPNLFKQIWFVASLIIYIVVQPIVAGILPKKTAKQVTILEEANGEELPEEYMHIGKQMTPLNNVMHASAIILIILMTLKPF